MLRQLLLITVILNILFFDAFSQAKTTYDSAQIILDNKEFKAYHGWIKYLLFDVKAVANRKGLSDGQVIEKQHLQAGC